MRKLLIPFLPILIPFIVLAEGPQFQHDNTFTQQEFENVYQDLRGKVGNPINVSSGTITTLNSTTLRVSSLSVTGQFNVGGNMTVATTGEVTQPLQPSFLATAPSNTLNVTGDGTDHTIEFDTEIFDQGSDFNTATYTFTAPVSGRYFLEVNVEQDGATTGAGHTNCALFIITSNRNYRNTSYMATASAIDIQNVSVLADMDANDTAFGRLTCSGGTKVVEVNAAADRCFFSGSLIN